MRCYLDNNIAIEVKNLCKTYKLYDRNRDRLREALHLTRKPRHKEHHALYDVSFEIKTGETVGIIGTNGSGKSTILKIITGVLNATSGEVNVNGRISALLELGAGFNPEYTGLENIYLNGTMIGFSEEEIDAKLEDILAFADIGDFVHQPVKTYSSGMFVRLAFALAINIEPEILIVDEALSVGDVFFQSKCYHKFEEFKEQGKTILFVSHDMSSIAKYCDRVILLEKGKKLGEGAPKKMLDIYKQVLVGQYEAPAEVVQEELDAAPPENAEDVEALEYGSGKAQITEVYVTDPQGRRINAVMKGMECTVHMVVEIRQDVPAPIFALSFKDVKGTEICGTNTMFEKAFLDPCKAGEKKEITFTQQVDLQGGEYLLSFGCTGYEGDDFTVYHRLYDALQLTVVSEKNTVGFYDMNSKVTVKDI
ncbi:MAG: ABC transporter ATP-binding protein [Lachnospiraceae bacterium]|nr:ABC transporter ATP-binding protein [Lachnospiraceae bacterium]